MLWAVADWNVRDFLAGASRRELRSGSVFFESRTRICIACE